jgi:acetylornithine aminotransferase
VAGVAAEGVRGRLVTLAKGLGGGFPIGACVAVGPAADPAPAGQHGTTFGGNPLASRAALTVLDIIESEGCWSTPERDGRLARRRDRGLGLPADQPRARAGAAARRRADRADQRRRARRALEAGFIVNAPRPDVLRLAPPLIITTDDLQPFVDALPGLVA